MREINGEEDDKLFIAHIRKTDGSIQDLRDHLLQTAEISGCFATKNGFKNLGYLAGLLHDMGKFSDDFQTYIKQAQLDPNSVKRGSVDHSTYGGLMVAELAKTKAERSTAEILANSIFSHHSSSGQLDYLASHNGEMVEPYVKRVEKRSQLSDYDEVKERFFANVTNESEFIELLKKSVDEVMRFKKSGGNFQDTFFLNKFIYSCLLDADRTNTYLFEADLPFSLKDYRNFFQTSQKNLELQFDIFKNGPQTPINVLRQKMADETLEAGRKKTDIYTLSIPTGGGKTLASLRFAFEHALLNGKNKIIYIVPYTTIIEQNANEVRRVIKNEEAVLEHHSNIFFDTDTKDVEGAERRQALLQDNWDSPIIFTTMVRFLEVVFAGGTRNPRRFHQMMNAVLIFDEIQAIPPKTISMFNKLLEFLKKYGNTTSLLCTATQPSLDELNVKLDIPHDNEIITDLDDIIQKFTRVEIVDKSKNDFWNVAEITRLCQDIMQEKNSLLVILNTKKAVRKVYDELKDVDSEISLFHLSTSMCAKHRIDVLTELKKKLEKGEPVLCVTTPLIEAGVDISFESVIRSITGMDSIAQAAGRCNRHGESATPQPVYLINPEKSLENIDNLKQILIGQSITKEKLSDIKFLQQKVDLLFTQPIKSYFKKYYNTLNAGHQLNYPVQNYFLLDLMSSNCPWRKSFKINIGEDAHTVLAQSPNTIAQNFNVIESEAQSVIVPYGDEGAALIAEFKSWDGYSSPGKWYKEAQHFTVNVFEHEFRQLEKNNLLEPVFGGEGYCVLEAAYDNNFGLNLEGDSKSSPNII